MSRLLPNLLLPSLLLVLQPIVFFRGALLTQDRTIPYDLVGFHQALTDFVAYSVRQGEFPLWDPNPYCGYPIHADLTAQIFYPPAWLAVVARNVSAPGTTLYWLEWLIALHMMLAGLLAFLLLRRMGVGPPAALLGATAFQLGGFFASQAQHLGAVCGAAWVPLAWCAVWELRERTEWKWVAWLAIALAMSFLAGFPAITFVAWFSTAALAAMLISIRRAGAGLALRFALGAAAAVPVMLVQLVPTMWITPLTHAGGRGSWSLGGIPWRGLWSLLWPDFHHVFSGLDPNVYKDPVNFVYLYWYCGLVTLVLVIAAVVTGGALARGFAALVVLFCVLQCGKFVPGASKLAEALPAVVRGGLYVEFFLAAFVLAFAVTAALGLDRWPRSWTWVVPIVVAAELIWSGSHRPMNSAPTGWRETSSETSFVNDRKFPALLHKLVGTTTPPLRIDTFDLAFDFTQSTSLRRLPTPNGDNALAPMRVLEIRRLFTVGNWWERQYPVRKFESPWLDFLNVGYLLDLQHPVDKDALLHAGWEEVPSGMWARLFRNLEVMPRFFLAAKVRAVRDAQESLQAAQNLDPRQEAVVEGAAPPAEASGRVEVIDYRNNRVTLTSESAGRSLLVTSETWSPGWKAKVDGRLVDLLVVNHAFRGLALDAGQHRIEMTYSPGYVWPLLGLGLVWFGLLLFLACR